MIGWAHVLIAAVTLQRLAELAYATRNTRALLAKGGQETGAAHYPLFVLLHGGWLAAMAALTAPNPAPGWFWLTVFAACQALRLWVIATLGPYWTTRIVTLAGAPPVTAGPYRLLRHPNYAIVAVEIPALPLALGMPIVALVFGAANLALLGFRIAIENAARRALS